MVQSEDKTTVCPHCGYCPHCGRSNDIRVVQPYVPYVPVPIYPAQQTWTVKQTVSTNGTSLTADQIDTLLNTAVKLNA